MSPSVMTIRVTEDGDHPADRPLRQRAGPCWPFAQMNPLAARIARHRAAAAGAASRRNHALSPKPGAETIPFRPCRPPRGGPDPPWSTSVVPHGGQHAMITTMVYHSKGGPGGRSG